MLVRWGRCAQHRRLRRASYGLADVQRMQDPLAPRENPTDRRRKIAQKPWIQSYEVCGGRVAENTLGFETVISCRFSHM